MCAVRVCLRVHAIFSASGVLGGQSILFAKSVSELVKAACHGDDGFSHFSTYIIITALVVCQVLQIHFLNGALTHYDALSVVPLFQVRPLGPCSHFVFFGETWWGSLCNRIGCQQMFVFV